MPCRPSLRAGRRAKRIRSGLAVPGRWWCNPPVIRDGRIVIANENSVSLGFEDHLAFHTGEFPPEPRRDRVALTLTHHVRAYEATFTVKSLTARASGMTVEDAPRDCDEHR